MMPLCTILVLRSSWTIATDLHVLRQETLLDLDYKAVDQVTRCRMEFPDLKKDKW